MVFANRKGQRHELWEAALRLLPWGAAIVLLIAVGLVAMSIWGPSMKPRRAPLSSPPSDPRAAQVWNAIQLVGVCPDGGDDLVNAQGEPIGKQSLGLGPCKWQPDSQARSLLFDLPQSPELDWEVFPEVHVSASGTRLGVGTGCWTANFQGKHRRFIAMTLARTYQERGLFWSHTVPIDRIDVTLKYYLPDRGKAACTFMGPFQDGKAVQRQEGIACRLTPTCNGPSDRGTMLHISAFNVVSGDGSCQHVLVYDVQGKRYRPNFTGGSFRGTGNRGTEETDCVLETLPLRRIAAITVGEFPQEKTFYDIVVRYPDRPARDYPPYLDQMAAALGLRGVSGKQLESYNFKTAKEALEVVDIVRGLHIGYAWQRIRSVDFAELSKEGRDKLRRTAKLWADNGVVQGIEMGLKGQWPEFVAPALEMLRSDTPFRPEVAHALRSYRAFTSQELEQVAVMLEQRNDPRGLYDLIGCLAQDRRRPGAREALLRLAHSDKVWLWWPAMQSLSGSGNRQMDQMPRDLQIKHLVVYGPQPDADPALAAETRALVAKLPSAELAAMSTSTMGEVIRSVAANLPRAQAQATLLDLLQDMVDHEEDYRFEGYSTSTWWAIDLAVRYLNQWNNLNLGGVGSDVNNETTDSHRIDWLALAKEALARFGRN
ncbi:MAG: hypothetical protein ACYC35_29545 [Pirellulales bacterium]